jgi:hypothetical protein
VVGAEGRHQASAFQQHHTHERGNLSRFQGDPLMVREPRIGANVVHHNGLAALIRSRKRRAECICWPRSDKGGNTAHVLAANRVGPIFDFHIADTVDVEMLAEQPRGGFLHVERIADRPEHVGEFEEEGVPLFARAQRLLAVRRVDERSEERDGASFRVEFWRRSAEDPTDAAVGEKAPEVGLPRYPRIQRRLDLARNRLEVVGVDRPLPAELPGFFKGEPGQISDPFAHIEAAAVEVGTKNADRQRMRGDHESWITGHGSGV